MKKFLPLYVLLVFVLIKQTALGQYQVINNYNTNNYGFSWVAPAGIDSIRVGMWGAGYQNGYNFTEQQTNKTYNVAGGGGAFTLSSAIPVTTGKSFFASLGIGYNSGYSNWTVPFWQNTTFGPLPNGSYDTAYGGYFGVGGAASVVGPYVERSWAGGGVGTNGYTFGAAGASANLYGPGASGTNSTVYGVSGQPGIGQYGGASGTLQGQYSNPSYYEPASGIAPGGGGGTFSGGSGAVTLAAHFNHNDAFNTPGTYQWVVPPGVSTIYVQLWGGGGGSPDGRTIFGGGGAFSQSCAIPVTPGQKFNVVVGYAGSTFNTAGGASTFGPVTLPYLSGSYTDTAYGAVGSTGGVASSTSSGFLIESYAGGNGSAVCGGAAANPFGGGLNAPASGNPVFGYYGGGSGANYNNTGTLSPGGGGLANSGSAGGAGAVIISYTCDASPYTGSIGNGHTVAYPPELIPDSITSTMVIKNPSAVSYIWQQSADTKTWVTAKTPTTALGYRFDRDSLQATTYYRRGNSACYTVAGQYGNWTDTVQVKVLTPANGRNGQIVGYVQTRNGSPINSRTVYVKSLTPLKGRALGFLDSAVTTSDGRFEIDNIFYGDTTYGDSGTVRLMVYADTTGKHVYSPASVSIKISRSTAFPYTLILPFRDTTVFAITGQVYQVCSGCLNGTVAGNITGPLDSVRVTGFGLLNSTTNPEADSAKTSYLNPPAQYGRYGLSFKQPDTYTVTPVFNSHRFVPANSTVVLNSSVGNINFQDTTTHVISGYYTAGCRDNLGTATLEFDDVLFDSAGKPRQSVFRKQVTTDATGYYSIRLPARKYRVLLFSGSVDAADSLTGLTFGTVQSFFAALPADSVTRDITNADATLNLVYKRTAQLVVSGLDINCTNAGINYDVWPQGTTRQLTFNAYQGPVAKYCPLDSAYVVLSTSIPQQDNNRETDTIKLLNGQATYSLKAGSPFTLPPYRKIFNAYVYDQYGRLPVMADTSTKIVVTGVSTDTLAQTFVTVTPQLPLLVLHDPPGNQSFSAWSSTTSNQVAFTVQGQSSTNKGAYTQIKFGNDNYVGIGDITEIKAWVDVNGSIGVKATTANTSEFDITTSNTTTLQTSSASNAIGPDADIFYGAAMNVKYTVGSEVDWDSTSCGFAKKNVMVFAPTGIKTRFIYTLAQIRDVQIPKLQLAAQANPDSASYYLNQVKVWQQLLANNTINQQKAAIDSNFSFSAGTSITQSSTLTNNSTNTYEFTMELDSTEAVEGGFQVSGAGVKGGVNISTQWTTGKSLAATTNTSTTTSYTLADGNQGDLFSVNVKTDPVYGTPMFETVAGESNCPHEAGTVSLDSVSITSNVPFQKGVAKDTAVFIFTAGNLSIDPNPRTYKLYLNAASNPDGAFVYVNGQQATQSSPVLLTIGNSSQVKVTVNVIRNSAGGVYNYDNLIFTMADICDGDIAKNDTISVDFASPVSGVTLVAPVTGWLANMASNNIVPIQFKSYDTSRLQTIAIQYDSVGSPNWTTVTIYNKTALGSSITGTAYNWNVAGLRDGSYNVRLLVMDKYGNVVYSPLATGQINRTPPALYGVPQPSNKIYTSGTQISFSYTENINNTNLPASMVVLQDLTKGITIPVQLSAFANTLQILPTTSLDTYRGDNFMVITSNVTDLYGNVKPKPDTAYFTVGTPVFSTDVTALNVTIGTSSLYVDATNSMDVHFTRNTATTTPTVVYYNLSGNGIYGQDYTVTYSLPQYLTVNNTSVPLQVGINGSQGAILLPAGVSSVIMYIHPVNNLTLTVDKAINISLSAGGGYSLGSNYAVTATIKHYNLPLPIITSFTPATGAAGTTVTITGANFTSVSAVSFGGVAAKSFTVVSSNSIQAVVGTGVTGSVSVTTPGGTGSLAGFTYCTPVAPTVTIAANIASPICTGTKVTFTATPVNGGAAPTYQWYKNNVVVGTASTYTDSLLKNSDSVWCVLTSNSPCATTTTATSSKLKYTVNALIAPTVTIAANIASPICTGTKVTFTATPVNGGAAPTYQWYKNNVVVGTASTYTDSLLKNSDSVWCVLTSNAACTVTKTATSSKLKYTVNALAAPSLTITANIASPICTGTKVTFTATPVNGGTAPTYLWYKNNAVVGTASTYTDSLLKNSDSVWCVLTSNAACTVTKTATSSKLKYTVNALSAPTVSIAANIASPICTGTKVTFTATPVNGGTAPTYLWYKNNAVVGTASTYTDSLLKNSDSVWCVLTSNAACITTTSATSSKLKYTVNALSAPSVTIAANIASPICTGTKVTFTATPVNGGTAPAYQWYKNNVIVGTASTYTDSLLKNSDSVWCVLTSNSACITTTTATSSKLKYTVNALSAPSLTIAANIASPICTGTKVTFTATPVNGGTAPTYLWYKNNVAVGTASTYTDSLLKNSDSVWCVLTSNAACITTTSATSSKLKYTVNALSAPSLTIAANIASPICTGTKVTFTATAVNGGTAPAYQWYKNKVVVGTASTYTDSLLKNSDSIWCMLTSNAACITTTSATSSKLKYTVNALSAPSLTIAANIASPICTGTKVTFTATPVNGGTAPTYQWYKNNAVVGTASTYTDSLLKNSDSVWCVLTSNAACITTITATSSKLKYTVNALSAPTVSIAANIASPICTGTKVTFTATPVNGGTAPTYQWYKNNVVVGTASTYTDSLLKNSDSVWCVLTSNAACITTTTATSSKLKYTVNALSAPTVSIAANIASPICTGTKVIFTATPVNGGTSPAYQWYKNNAVVGTASTYTDSLLKNSDSIWCVLTSNSACATTTTATSGKLKYTVNALIAPTVTIAANIASPICTGTKITFTATAVNGGTAPTYQWYKNNAVVGTASTYTDSLLKNSDSVWCVLTSNAACITSTSATSSKLKYTVNALSAPTVSIAANIASPICTGTKVTFTATPVNGGTAPAYQWYKNNVVVGTASTYTDSLLKNSDSIWCVLTSNSACATTTTATSSKLKYTVNALSAPSLTIAANIASPICTGTKVTFTATPVNGGAAPTYLWYKNNVVVATASTYTDSLLKNSDSVWCVLTSNAACISTNTATSSKLKYTVNALSAPSVSIAANIASPICTGTKVTFTATPVNGGASPVYQWYKNNVAVGTASTYTDSLLKNSDSVWCVLTSNATCITTTSATSSKLKYTVNAGTAPTVSISANPGNTLCYGTKDVFTATALNAGTTPAYQWYRSNIKVGTSASTYTDSMLKGGDSVWVVVSANTGCGAGSATSNKIGIVQAGAAQNFAYIPNGYSKTVSVVNINTGKLVATVPLGTGVGGVSVTPDSKKVYFTNSQDNTVSVLSTATNTITKTISGFGSPQGVVVSPDGSKAYVVNASGLLYPEIMAINVNADTIMPSAAINGGLSGLWVSITPDGKKLYVANQSNSISVLSTTTNSLVKTISMNFPWGITVSPDSKKAYVSNYNNNTVSVINAVADTLMTVIPVGTNPLGLAASPDGSKVYVTNTGSSSIGIINTTTNAVTGTIAVDSGPYGISITPDGGTLVTANDYSNTANIVSTATNSSTSSVGIGGSPLGLGNFIASLPSACPVLTPAVSITANTPATLCANTKVTFTAAPVNGGSVPAYQWYKNSKTVGTNSVTYLDSLLKTGDSVWCVLTSNAAPLAITTAKSNILVFTVSTVVTPSVTIVPSVASPICAGAKVSFTATVVNGGTAPAYQWYKNNTVVGTASTYTDSLLKNSDSVWCVVTGNANCTAGNTAKSNRLYYTVNALPVKPTLTQKGVTSFCLYDSLILTATVTPGTLQWYRNNGAIKLANTSRYAVKVAGSYKLLLTGSNGCAIMSDSVIATVTQVARPTITLVNDTLVSSAAAGNQWYENSVLLPGATGKTFAPINIDAYTVQATSAGCVSPMSDPYIYTAGTFAFKGKTPGAGKANALLYPNPAGSTANLRLSGFTSGVIVTVTDMTGKVVWQQDKLVNSTYTLPLSNLAQGNYIVTVKDKTAIISLRLIKGK